MIKLKNPGKIISKEVMERFQKEMKIKFPKDYVDFVLEHNGAEPENNSFKGKNHIEVRRFLSVPDGIAKRLKEYKNRIPQDTLPIAEDSSGNLILLSFRNSSVYFWDHEIDDVGEGEKNDSKPQKIASSFTEFFKKLERFDVKTVGNIEYISPDFHEEFRQYLKK